MMGDLYPTNVALIVMAVVSVLEALVLIGIAVGGFMVYRRIMQLVNDLEERQIAPVRAKVDAILGDVKTLTARVSEEAERVDHAIHGTINRVDDTAGQGEGELRGRSDSWCSRRDRLAAAHGAQAEAACHGRGTALAGSSDGRENSEEGVSWHTNTIVWNVKMEAGRF
jgi:hypothetical protein